MNRKLLIAILILFIGINSSNAQFRMGNTLTPLTGNLYPIILSNDAQGGLHQVATIAERNAIPALRRQQGMLCAVLDAGSGTPKTYQLIGGILDTNWVNFVSGTGTSVSSFSDLSGLPTTIAGFGITDAISTAHVVNGITGSNITNWNTAFGWGNHAGMYRQLSWVPTWTDITSNPFVFSSAANNQLIKYNSGSGKWENWTPNYISGYTETDPVFGAWNKSTGIIITTSQISDFSNTVTGDLSLETNKRIAADAIIASNLSEETTRAIASEVTKENVTNKVTFNSALSTNAHYPSAKLMYDQLLLKVNTIPGKVLSTNDYTAAEKSKVSTISGINTGDQDLSVYAMLSSPAFTDIPTAPTAESGTNSTQIATTAFVSTAVGSAIVAASIPDAGSAIKGKIQLSGDLTGTADLPVIAPLRIDNGKIADNTITNGKIASTAAIADTKLATISSVGKVLNSATTATKVNTPSTIVERDANGDFSAGTITGNLEGTASIATHAITADNVSGTIPVDKGGTGAITAPAALVNLGIGSVNNTSDANKPISTAQQTALNAKVNSSLVGVPNGVASLGSNGLIPTAQIPPISFTSVQVLANEAEMLALTGAIQGSMVVRTDNNRNYVLAALPSSTLGNWVQLVSTGSNVQSVNGKIGTIILTASDLNLGNVQNTSDANKVISNPTLAALNLREEIINKSTDVNLGNNDVLYPSQNAVKSYVDTKVATGIVNATTISTGVIQLAGDLGGTATLPVVTRVGGSTAASIYSATTAANAATSSLTGSTLVKRDGSGNFTAGTITATLNGNATTATTAATATNATTATNISGIVAISNGGTGATTLAGAKSNLGLANVNNTTDLAKPISTLTQAALNQKVNQALVGVPNGLATLNDMGLVPTSQIPPLSFTTVMVLSSETDMLALNAPLVGSMVIRTDNNSNYILASLPATDIGNWVKLLTMGAGVQTVNGQTGMVYLTSTDLGLGQVENTADINKPISTLTQSELDLKEIISNKSTDPLLGTDDLLYPSQKAVKIYVDSKYSAGLADATASVKGKIKLAGDLGGTADIPTITRVGNSLANSVSNATILTNTATDLNTPGMIVKRDGSGNFSAGIITATSLLGNATSATTAISATNVTGVVLPANGGTGVSSTSKAFVFAGPSGAAGVPSFRALTVSDLPPEVNNFLPLVGGTLTGAINGTTAAFNSLGVTGAATAATVNGLNLTSMATGFTLTGGTNTPKTLIVNNDAIVAGTNSGDVVINPASQSYLTISGQSLTAGLVNLNNQTTGTLPASGFPVLTGDVTTSGGSLASTIAPNVVTTSKIANGNITYAKVQPVTLKTLLGNPTATTGAVSEITLGSGLSFTGTTLNTTNTGTLTNITGTDNRIVIGGTATVPTIDIAPAYVGQTSITTLGAIGTGVWNGSLVAPAYGGTGMNNGSNTLTLAGNLATSGAFPVTLTSTAATAVTLPTSGTLATLAGTEALTGKTINGLTPAVGPTGFTIAGGTLSRTLTVNSDASVSGINTGDQTLSSIGAVGSNALIVAATNTKITYDAKGLVTSGSAATTNDIAPSTDKNYVTDAQKIVINNTSGANTGDQINVTGTAANVTGIVLGNNGGTGINNSGKTITLGGNVITGGNLTTSGAFTTTLTSTATTTLTLPTTGTLATLSGTEALTGKTINGLTPTAISTGFTIGGGIIPKTLTVASDATVSGNNTGDQTLSGLGGVTGNALIAGATYTKITYDAKGLVTGGAAATTADIASSLDKNYVTDAQKTVIGQTSGINSGDQTLAGLLGVPSSRTVNTIALTADIVLTPDNMDDGATAHKFVAATDIANWNNKQAALGFTPENIANKVNDISATSTVDQYPNAKLTFDQLALKSPLASPDFTDIPTAPTAAVGTATNQIATTSFVSNAVSSATPDATTTLIGKIKLAGDLAGTADAPVIAPLKIDNSKISETANIADTKLATIQTPGKVVNAATTATAANTPGAIVARDASGNFTAGTITANLTGNASTATLATSVTNNASLTGMVTSVGNVTTVVTNANLTGAVTSSGNTTSIAAKAVTLDKMSDMATGTLIYRKTASTGVPELQTLATLKTDLGLTGNNSGDQTNVTGTSANVTGVVLGINGGTGIANSGKTISLGGSLTTSGAFTTTLTSTATTALTLPVTGTLATLTGAEALTNKTINGLTPTAVSSGFTIAGGTTSKILTVSSDATVSGSNTGDQILPTLTSLDAVPTSRTINTKALSSNIILDPDDLNDASTNNKFVTAANIANWDSKQEAGAYLIAADITAKEEIANKVTSFVTPTDIQYPGAKLVSDQLNLKVAKTTTVNGYALSSNVTITASDVNLGNVTNESKATMFASPVFTGTVSGITPTMVGLGNVSNTVDLAKPVSTATQTALDLKANIASPTFTGMITGNLTGNVAGNATTATTASTVTTNANLTGDVTSVGNATTIGANKVTYAKMQTVSASRLLGNPTAATANASEITVGSGLNLSVGGILSSTLAGGSVTTLSVATANGISGSVATPSTTPAITLTLGAITPTSVAATGAVSGSNLSGTNTGDNASNSLYSSLVSNATHTGDVTGSTTLTIAPNVVSNADLNTVPTATIKGRITAATGNVEDLTKAQVLSLLNVADGANNYVHPLGDGNLHVPLTSTTNNGKVLTAGATAGSLSWVTPATGSVTSASVVTANGVSGTVANATTAPAITLSLGAITPTSVVASGNLSGTQLTSTVATGTAPLVVTSTTPVANLSIGGNAATATTASTVTTNANLTGDVTSLGNVTTIAANVISNADLNIVPTATLKGRITAATGDVEDLTKAQVLSLLNVADGANNYVHPLGDGNLHVPATGATNNGKVLTAGATAGSVSWITPTIGTVTTASVVTANGVSGTVATSTTTPAITLTLGAITPTSVAATGAIAGTTGSFSTTLGVTGNTTLSGTLGVTGNTTLTGNLNGTPSSSNIAGFNAAFTAIITTTYTLLLSDNGKIITINNASPITVTIPTLTAGFNCMFVQTGAGQITFVPSATTINNRNLYTKTAGQYAIATIVALTSNNFVSSGDMQ